MVCVKSVVVRKCTWMVGAVDFANEVFWERSEQETVYVCLLKKKKEKKGSRKTMRCGARSGNMAAWGERGRGTGGPSNTQSHDAEERRLSLGRYPLGQLPQPDNQRKKGRRATTKSAR